MQVLNKIPLWLLAVLGAVLLWAGWPMSPLPIFLAVGWIPLLMAEQRIAENDYQGRKGWRFWRITYLFLLVWNALTTWWIWHASEAGGVFAILANAALQSIPVAAARWSKNRLGNPDWAIWLLPAYWIAFEYLHLNWDLSWSWLTLGNGLAYWPVLAQWYEYTGALGGSLWILSLNILIFKIFFAKEKPKTSHWLTTTAVLIVPVLFSAFLYYSYKTPEQQAEVVVIQPNIDPYTEKFADSPNFIPLEEQIARFIQLSEEKITLQTQWVLWPETAVDALVGEENIENEAIIQQIQEQFLKRYPHVHLLTGITSYKLYEDASTSPTARYKAGIGHYDVFNTALHLQYGKPTQIYHKSKLVPGVEQMPYPAVFKFLMSFVIDLGGTSGGMGSQSTRTAFATPASVVAPVICYESIYGDFTTGFMRDGANFIGIITNDGWWKNSPGHRQHWAYASLRAIENRRDIARCANTGISGFVTGRGDRQQATAYWTQAVLSKQIKLNNDKTLYTRFGDYIGILAAVATFGLFLFSLVKTKH
ncbi:apolipoprotein N-acyltransferase [Flexibacter flexilis]|uniref:apolipoprotein N-acyltransferase n=1 Tax=Flexibacter flexilis TaxID=998 RepID=UPI001FE0DEDE|nr:apolipoprotein N-acyltransferase [Flexibacter flexilis]